MNERHGGLWLEVADDDGAIAIFDHYDSQRDCILVIRKRRDGRFQPWVYKKIKDYHLSLPCWVPMNEKTIFASEQEAAAYLDQLKSNA